MRIGLERANRHLVPVLILCLFGLLINLMILPSLEVRLAWYHDDNPIYYAERYCEGQLYRGDTWHNVFQKEYPYLTIVFWLPALLLKYFGVPALFSSFLITALKVLLLTVPAYGLAYILSKRVWASVLAAIAVYSGDAIYWNLDLHGFLKGYPYQSELSYGTLLLCMLFMLQRKPVAAYFSLVITFLIHFSIGIYGVFFMLFLTIFNGTGFTRTKRLAFVLGLVLLPMLLSLPARNILSVIPANELASSKFIYQELNETHGALWDAPSGTFWSQFCGFFVFVGFFLLALWSGRLRRVQSHRAYGMLILASALLVILGCFAKVMCIVLLDSEWLKYAIRFHQLLMARASVFTLILMLIYLVAYLSLLLNEKDILVRSAAGLSIIRFLDINQYSIGSFLCHDFVFVNVVLWAVLVWGELRSRGIFYSFMARHSRIAGMLRLVQELLLARVFAILAIYMWPCWSFPYRTALSMLPPFLLFRVADWRSLREGRVWNVIIQIGLLLAYGVVFLTQFLSQIPVRVTLVMLLALIFIWTIFRETIGSSRLTLAGKLAASLGLITALNFAVLISYAHVCDIRDHDRPQKLDWHEVCRWARENTPVGSSFLFLTGDGEYALPNGWRTFSKRGMVLPLRPYVTLAYTPDMRLLKPVVEMRAYLRSRYAGKNDTKLLTELKSEDLDWLRDYSGAEFAVARSSVSVCAPVAFSNDSFIVYTLVNLLQQEDRK